VDNGKIMTTAGLSAGIDGALHMIEVMDGHDVAQTVALDMEYDWRPQGDFVRAAMADRMNPDPDLDAIGEMEDRRIKGDTDHWQIAERFSTKLSATELFEAVKAAYEKGYAAQGPWSPGSIQAASSGLLAMTWRFDDRQGHRWHATLTVEPVPNDSHQFIVRLATSQSASQAAQVD
jgi:hypothetical protein